MFLYWIRVSQPMSMLWQWEPWVRHLQGHLSMRSCQIYCTPHQGLLQLVWVVVVPWVYNTRGHGVPLPGYLWTIRYLLFTLFSFWGKFKVSIKIYYLCPNICSLKLYYSLFALIFCILGHVPKENRLKKKDKLTTKWIDMLDEYEKVVTSAQNSHFLEFKRGDW